MLGGDPIGTFSLTPHGLADNINTVLQWGLPTILTGGGGYNYTNTARFWTVCTATVAGEILTNEIPEHDCFEHYSPDFDLLVAPNNRPDENTDKYVVELLHAVETQLMNVTCNVDK